MTIQEIETWLSHSLEDRRFSRNERQSLKGYLSSLGTNIDREDLGRLAFKAARSFLKDTEGKDVLDWLEEVSRTLREIKITHPSVVAEAYFSPGDECLQAIQRLLTGATKTADLCVFTITDDRISDAIIETHRRGVKVRIITDDAKAEDLGSDIDRLASVGIALCVDRSPYHMHHKFAIFDRETLLTGSYNWTRGAARDNEENLIVTSETRLLMAFQQTFDKLWGKLASSHP